MANAKALVLDGARFREISPGDTLCDGNWGSVGGTGVQAANTVYVAEITGVLRTGATSGTLQVQAATEVANSGITIKAYSGGTLLAR